MGNVHILFHQKISTLWHLVITPGPPAPPSPARPGRPGAPPAPGAPETTTFGWLPSSFSTGP